ncbi:MAG: NAD-dependent epimerase/dehydratase family protein [Nitrospinae bacterium]|nr:NAD-dependent epimerase/dehydratase family protein [Nitrospinota bacterium]
MNILLTGATGFIGCRLLRLLEKEGHCVTVISRKKHPHNKTIVCDFVKKDKIPQDAMDAADTVFHLAGYTHDLSDASKVEHLYRAINIDSTINLATQAIQSNIKKFIYISSVKAGGSDAKHRVIDENTSGEPEGIYGKTKREAEKALLKLTLESNMHTSIVRPSPVYGPGVKGNLQLMLKGIKSGWFPPIPEVGNKRSLVHVDDVARAICYVSEDKRADGEIFIVTDGKPYSSRDIYNSMRRVLGMKSTNLFVPKLLFGGVSLLGSRFKYKVNKLLGDEYYSSKKLASIGFEPSRTLDEMNETDF